MRILATVYRGTAKRIVGVVLVEPVIFVQHRNPRLFQRGDVTEHIPHHFKVIVHLPSATHIKALGHVPASVATAAGKLQFFKQMNVLSLHLSVTDQVKRRRESRKSRTDDIRRLLVNVLRLLGMRKRFVSSC